MTLGSALLLFCLSFSHFASDGGDLARLEHVEPSPPVPTFPLTFEGTVLGERLAPAAAVRVVSSSGGRARTAADGSFRIDALVPADAREVEILAVQADGASGLVARTRASVAGVSGVVSVGTLVLTRAGCAPSWKATFGQAPGVSQDVNALAVFDDGSGPALYVGGSFTTAGGVAASNVARWDGSRWSALGAGTDAQVQALAVFDDGDGPALYAGGAFASAGGLPANRIARWDGSAWSAVGSGTNERVRALAVFDDGNGAALYAGGHFSEAGGVLASRVARWNGADWSALAAGVSGAINGSSVVRALAVFDDGGGPQLYTGGDFTMAGGAPSTGIARWNGSAWSTPGGGLNAGVRAFAVDESGGQPTLYAAGRFTSAGGIPASRIAKWDGASWSALGSGLDGDALALAVFDDGSGPALFAGGQFESAGGTSANNVAKWDGSDWSPLSTGTGVDVAALVVFDGGGGPALHAGGFAPAQGVFVHGIAAWDGANWSALGDGLDRQVDSLLVHDDGEGPALFVGGVFETAGGQTRRSIAKWKGASWNSLGAGIADQFPPPIVWALGEFDAGGGPAQYAGGRFDVAGAAVVDNVARWQGDWFPMQGGVAGGTFPFLTPYVYAFQAYDDGSGEALYVGGGFTEAGGVTVDRLGRWNGSSWSAVGGGVFDEFASDTTAVRAMAVHDDGSGPALYVGGTFSHAGGVPVANVARWDGASWSAVGGGNNCCVQAFAVFDDGSGPALYAGGHFTTAGGVSANRIARWDGSNWHPLGGGANAAVWALRVFDDGSGPALYAAGAFTTVDGLAAERIARWDGTSWSALGGGLNGPANAFAVLDDGSDRALVVGGAFSSANDSLDSYLARWTGCPDSAAPVLSCAPHILVSDDPSSPPGAIVHFTVHASDNLDPSPDVVCVPPSGSLFPPGTTTVVCTATDDMGNESTCEFLVSVQPKFRRR